MSDPAVYGVMGFPVKKSLSSYMHNAAFELLGINATYLPFEVNPGEVDIAINDWINTGVQGGNVTVPHKETVASLLNRLEGDAARLKTVNTLVRDGDQFVGHTTDGEGLVRSLGESGVELAGKKIVMLGAGGAAKSIGSAIVRNDIAELIIVNRTTEKAEQLVSLLGSPTRTGSASDVKNSDVLINATSLGMNQDDLPSELDDVVANIDGHQAVADIVYFPRETALLRVARERGSKTVEGLGMLLHQAAMAFELWTKQPAPVEVMRDALLKAAD